MWGETKKDTENTTNIVQREHLCTPDHSCPLQGNPADFLLFWKSLWDKDVGCDVVFEECIVSQRGACPSPWRQRNKAILNSGQKRPADAGCAVMSANGRPFNTYLFWGSRSHRPKTEAYVMTIRSPPPSLPICLPLWVLLGRVQRALQD